MNTTISIPVDLRDELKSFGHKGETYGEIIERLIKVANEKMLENLLMDTKDCISAKDALDKAKKKWQK